MNQQSIEILKANGVSLDIENLSLDIDKRKLPMLYHYKNDKFKFKLIYQHPVYGTQVFCIERQQIVFASANSKYLHTTPKDEQMDFITCLKATGLAINPVLEVVLNSFKISKSVLSKIKRGSQKYLSPKRNAVLKSYAVKRPKTISAIRKSPSFDEELYNQSLAQMNKACSNAASNFDLDKYFKDYAEAYRNHLKAQGKSPAVSLNKIEKAYIGQVNNLQK